MLLCGCDLFDSWLRYLCYFVYELLPIVDVSLLALVIHAFMLSFDLLHLILFAAAPLRTTLFYWLRELRFLFKLSLALQHHDMGHNRNIVATVCYFLMVIDSLLLCCCSANCLENAQYYCVSL